MGYVLNLFLFLFTFISFRGVADAWWLLWVIGFMSLEFGRVFFLLKNGPILQEQQNFRIFLNFGTKTILSDKNTL